MRGHGKKKYLGPANQGISTPQGSRAKKNYDMESAGDIVKWHYLVQPAKLKNRYLGTMQYVPQ